MNIEKVIQDLQTQYSGKNIVRNPENNPTEIVCEISPGLAVAVIDKSEPHYHNQTTETYEVLKGDLILVKDDQNYPLKPGDVFVINPKSVHYAIGNETWVKVYAEPAWSPDDHILV